MPGLKNDLTEGSVLKKLIIFAVPFLLSNIVQSLYNVADMLIVGRFCGPESMAGVNIGGQVTLILTNIVVGLCMGATVLISQYTGSKNEAALKRVTATILTLLVAVGVFVTVVMVFLREPILHLIQTPPEAFSETNNYLTVTLMGIVFIFAYNALSSILRGTGDSKHPFIFVLCACVTNIVLDLLFVAVFEWAAFGAALATVISQALSVVLCVIFMARSDFHFDFKLKSFRIHMDQLKLIFKIGLPTCVQNTVVSVSFLFITSTVNLVGGVAASAGVGAMQKFNSFAFMPTMAISASISTMAAQNIGANKLDRAIKACKLGTVFAVFVTYAFFVLVRVFPVPILSLFGDDSAMIAAGVEYLNTFSYDFLFIPFIFCLNGFFIGGGHTMFTLMSSMLSSVILRVPLTYLLGVTMQWGLHGIGMAAPIASAGAILAIVAFLMTGRWKHNVVKNRAVEEV